MGSHEGLKNCEDEGCMAVLALRVVFSARNLVEERTEGVNAAEDQQ